MNEAWLVLMMRFLSVRFLIVSGCNKGSLLAGGATGAEEADIFLSKGPCSC
jgi:hypothetical protein